jgi:hypothetical protein
VSIMATVAPAISTSSPRVESAGEDPVLAAFLRAPVDDRLETDEERAAVEAAKAAFLAAGQQ